jgi:4'-phosphopantetheinyl transferase
MHVSQSEFILAACPSNEKHAAFFRCWTGKEAYVKATGAGLAQPLHQIEVAAWAGARRLCIAGPVAGTVRWSLQNINPAPGYVAALVVEGQAGSLYGWQWPHWF